jgi:hypothetical protein
MAPLKLKTTVRQTLLPLVLAHVDDKATIWEVNQLLDSVIEKLIQDLSDFNSYTTTKQLGGIDGRIREKGNRVLKSGRHSFFDERS